ncbi:MAG: hypothetical protein RLZZ535_2795, partial [Cyanobacteriota bacterium]
ASWVLTPAEITAAGKEASDQSLDRRNLSTDGASPTKGVIYPINLFFYLGISGVTSLDSAAN